MHCFLITSFDSIVFELFDMTRMLEFFKKNEESIHHFIDKIKLQSY